MGQVSQGLNKPVGMSQGVNQPGDKMAKGRKSCLP